MNQYEYRMLPMDPRLWRDGELFSWGRRCPCNGDARNCSMWKMMCYSWCASHDNNKTSSVTPKEDDSKKKEKEKPAESSSESEPDVKTSFHPSRNRKRIITKQRKR